jgi:hypothetical protein
MEKEEEFDEVSEFKAISKSTNLRSTNDEELYQILN